MKKIILNLSGMGCAACAAKIDKKLNSMKSVQANVNFALSKATVSFSETSVTVDSIINTITGLGYSAELQESKPSGESHLINENKDILILK